MQYPVEFLARFTRKLDELIDQPGDRRVRDDARGCVSQ